MRGVRQALVIRVSDWRRIRLFGVQVYLRDNMRASLCSRNIPMKKKLFVSASLAVAMFAMSMCCGHAEDPKSPLDPPQSETKSNEKKDGETKDESKKDESKKDESKKDESKKSESKKVKTDIRSETWTVKWTYWGSPAVGMQGILMGNGIVDGKVTKVPMTYRKLTGFEVHCGSASYLLGSLDGVEVVACANAGSGIAVLTKDAVNQPVVAFVPYDTVGKKLGDPMILTAIEELVPNPNIKRYLSPQGHELAGSVGYFLVGYNQN